MGRASYGSTDMSCVILRSREVVCYPQGLRNIGLDLKNLSCRALLTLLVTESNCAEVLRCNWWGKACLESRIFIQWRSRSVFDYLLAYTEQWCWAVCKARVAEEMKREKQVSCRWSIWGRTMQSSSLIIARSATRSIHPCAWKRASSTLTVVNSLQPLLQTEPF